VTLLSLLVGLPAGRALGLYRFRGKSIVQFIILAPAIVPGFAAAMGIHLVFIRYGLTDTLPGVVLVHLIPVLPYVVLVLSGVFANFEVEAEEAARTLGANRWQVFRYVTLPAITPGVVAAALFAFMISWGQYLLTLPIGGGRVLTLPLLLLNFANSGDYAVTSALALVFIFPAAVILWAASRYLGGGTAALGGLGRL
jgi:putative spermidine/putrescine transport system permease protein